MTVAELIERLKGFPPDAPVIFRQYSEFSILDPEDVELVTAESERIARRHGRYMLVYKEWVDKIGTVEWATVVTFPGN